MKIEEMRSGISHLSKPIEGSERDDLQGSKAPAETAAAAAPAPEKPRPVNCDLDEPRWAVVSFDEIEAGGLTYRQAAQLLDELEMNDISGLCIVTDEAARRMAR